MSNKKTSELVSLTTDKTDLNTTDTKTKDAFTETEYDSDGKLVENDCKLQTKDDTKEDDTKEDEHYVTSTDKSKDKVTVQNESNSWHTSIEEFTGVKVTAKFIGVAVAVLTTSLALGIGATKFIKRR